MNVEEIIFNKYSDFGYKSVSGELYLPFKWALKLVEECNEQEIAVIGLDFVHINSTKIVPVSPLNGVDCSGLLYKHKIWVEVVKECNDFVINVLINEQNRDSTQYCNFVLLSISEWGSN
ncbi:hypothetical protein AMQ84_03380 [Paenibacillus riograndensis]|uniref:Uncharacterized protein n=1 Tax=Paenibacillus riograndensis TaxID=483937 RepID=A0A132U9W5_9BACL|nr:hypothetical protein [Paenibacillus riograndensis]KWX80494.1 hypothetical protein AMQ84_03380 [Paenibacillus riograndensis]